MRDAMLGEQGLGLLIVELQARAAHVVALQEVRVLDGDAIGGVAHHRAHAGGRAGVVDGVLGLAPGQGLASSARIGGPGRSSLGHFLLSTHGLFV